MPGKPYNKLRSVAYLRERFDELASDFDSLLPAQYRYNGQTPVDDARARAWGEVDKGMITTAAALVELEAELRKQLMIRSQPRGKDAKGKGVVVVNMDDKLPDDKPTKRYRYVVKSAQS